MTQLCVKPAQEEKGGGEELVGKGEERQKSELHLRNPKSPRKEVSERGAGAASWTWDKRRTCLCVLSRFHLVQLWATLWTVARQVPLSLGFSRQEYWSGLPRLSPGDLPDPGIKPESLMSPARAGGLFTLARLGRPEQGESNTGGEEKSRAWVKGVNTIRY